MPYIENSKKKEVSPFIPGGQTRPPQTAGELNFIITSAIKQYIDYNGFNYQIGNDILGALEGAKLEFYRRILAPYEDTKIHLNGDVY